MTREDNVNCKEQTTKYANGAKRKTKHFRVFRVFRS